MAERKRTRLWVDGPVQGSLVERVMIYWAACMVFVTLPIALIQTLASPGEHLFIHYLEVLCYHWPILLALTAMVPLFIYDTLRFSHRFAGPISRLRRELGRYEQGEKVFPIDFRRGDFWRDLVDRINRVVERAETAERKLDQSRAGAAFDPSACELSRDVLTSEASAG
jgi:hypothetical protein